MENFTFKDSGFGKLYSGMPAILNNVINKTAYAVFTVLLSESVNTNYKGLKANECAVSLRYIAKGIGQKSCSNIPKALRELQSKGIISHVDRKLLDGTSIYRIELKNIEALYQKLNKGDLDNGTPAIQCIAPRYQIDSPCYVIDDKALSNREQIQRQRYTEGAALKAGARISEKKTLSRTENIKRMKAVLENPDSHD